MSGLEEIKRTSYKTAQSQSRVTSQKQYADSGRSELLSQLGRFSSSVGDLYDKSVQAEIETKKVLGASRAAKDMLVGESQRQGITEDDTLATQLSYNNILGQHDTIEAGNSYIEWYSQNPEADEAAISSKKLELYQPLLEKYGNDPRSIKQISLQVQESQFSLMSVENKINTEYKRKKSTEALGISVSDLMADPAADLDFVVGEEVPSRAKALGLGEFDYKKALMGEAQTRASDGDDRLLRKLQTEDWAKGSAALEKAESDFNKYVATERTPMIGNAMGDIEIENLSLNVPWSTTLRKITDLNKQFEGTYSQAKISSMKQARENARVKAATVGDGVAASYSAYTDANKLPLALDPNFSPDSKKEIIKSLEERWPVKQRELVASGVSEEDAANLVINDQLKWSRLNRIAIPSLKSSVETLINLNDEEITNNNGKLPDYALNGLKLFKKMDQSTVELYLPSSTDQAFVGNFKDFSLNMSDDAAYQRATQIKRNPYKVTPAKREEQTAKSRDVIDTMLSSNSWYENLFNSGEGMVNIDVPDWQKEILTAQWNTDIDQRLYAGGFNPESNASEVVKAKMSRMSQLNNGTITNLPTPELSSYIAEGAPQGTKVSSKNALDYMEAYMLASKPYIDAAYGSELQPDEISVQFDRGGKMFRFFSSNGDPIGGRIATSSVYNIGREANLEELRSIMEESKKARLAQKQMEDTARFLPNAPIR